MAYVSGVTPTTHNDVFRVIADPTRRAILGMLADRPQTVTEISTQFEMRQPSISLHLQVLRDFNLVEVRRSGRHRVYSIVPEPLQEVATWLLQFERFWKARLDRLSGVLDKMAREKK